MDEIVTRARVKCLGKYHTLGLTSKGRLRLLHHKKGEEETLAVLMLLNPEERCRCHEALDAWRWYTMRNTPSFWDLRDSHPWIEKAFISSYGGFESPTDSKLLSAIPKPFHHAAREAKETGKGRRNYQPPQETRPISERFSTSWSAKNAIRTKLNHRALRIMERGENYKKGASVCGQAAPEKFLWDCHREKSWWRACEAVGYMPSSVPPSELWEYNGGVIFPPLLKVRRLKFSALGDIRNQSPQVFWAKISWEGGEYSVTSNTYGQGERNG